MSQGCDVHHSPFCPGMGGYVVSDLWPLPHYIISFPAGVTYVTDQLRFCPFCPDMGEISSHTTLCLGKLIPTYPDKSGICPKGPCARLKVHMREKSDILGKPGRSPQIVH